MSMKIGDLIRYRNMDGELVYGVVCKGTHKHTFDRGYARRDAIKVAWTDDISVTTELVEHILDPEHDGLDLL